MYKTNSHNHLLLFIKNLSSKRRFVAVTRKNTHFSTFEQCFSYTFIRSSTVDTCQSNLRGAWDDDSWRERGDTKL